MNSLFARFDRIPIWALALAALTLLAWGTPASARDQVEARELADRAAISEVMQKYVWSIDSLDVDGYVSVFTENAVIDSNGTLIQGHAAIRKVVTDLQTRYDANRSAGEPVGRLYHVISNERINFVSATEAVYRSYWQTMRKSTDNRYTAGGFGTSEDHLVKRHGQWLIQSRKLVVFTE